MYSIPELTLDLCKEGKLITNYYFPSDIIELLEKNGYKHLGWLNNDVFPPGLDDWMEQYANQSGSYCIYVSHSEKLIYCVDMGD